MLARGAAFRENDRHDWRGALWCCGRRRGGGGGGARRPARVQSAGLFNATGDGEGGGAGDALDLGEGLEEEDDGGLYGAGGSGARHRGGGGGGGGGGAAAESTPLLQQRAPGAGWSSLRVWVVYTQRSCRFFSGLVSMFVWCTSWALGAAC